MFQPLVPAPSTSFRLFGAAHLGMLGAVPLLALLLTLIERRLPSLRPWPRFGLAGVILLDTLLWYADLAGHGQLTFPGQLPLELCDATRLLTLITLLTLRPILFDVAYYGAMAGSAMALITPNLWEPFPSLATIQFFLSHGLVVTAALYLIWSGQARPRPGSVLRAMVYVNLWAAIAGTFDWVFKTDYMYLRAKPQALSLLSFLGPWPWYIASSEGVALGLFLLLYLPFRRPAASR
jgi:hypothetical integral membrane protein (TIGR02206 family)